MLLVLLLLVSWSSISSAQLRRQIRLSPSTTRCSLARCQCAAVYFQTSCAAEVRLAGVLIGLSSIGAFSHGSRTGQAFVVWSRRLVTGPGSVAASLLLGIMQTMRWPTCPPVFSDTLIFSTLFRFCCLAHGLLGA